MNERLDPVYVIATGRRRTAIRNPIVGTVKPDRSIDEHPLGRSRIETGAREGRERGTEDPV